MFWLESSLSRSHAKRVSHSSVLLRAAGQTPDVCFGQGWPGVVSAVVPGNRDSI